jgi:arsenate reductase (thioredoxin)
VTVDTIRVLFVCEHNSARSQMAEALLKKTGGRRFEVESAGLEPGMLNPFAVRAMADMGIDISRNRTKGVFVLTNQRKQYDYVITVCDEASGERCPLFLGTAKKLHWAFPDPSAFGGPVEEKLRRTIEVRDAIRKKIDEWLKELE